MLDRADALLKLALAIAALALGCGIGYYYAFFLPAQATLAAQAASVTEQAKMERDRAASDKSTAAAATAKLTYQICISRSDTDYFSQFNASCSRQHEADAKAKQNCRGQGFADTYCSSLQLRPAQDCALPAFEANNYHQQSQDAKQTCLDALKAGA
ncbi:hypothetical protein D3Y57_14370 [Sphingomonas paeninsulae]|uniref:Uncharacterized protein n=1 Tax=Sphingomonas paeninsulae TaxID=2319844 RepID=A0A494TN77_SPHPE|nr:hypothetical protein [Sphingomonas paeninsulae]AYJ86908.1 hypothetical protein D3Y57_14370 [Sphingomonas paeninsulae]